MRPIVAMRGSRGLNKRREAQRYLVKRPEGTTADLWLTEALNVYLDTSGMIKTRPGYSQADTATYHSPFSARGRTLIVKDGVLGILGEDLSFASLYSPVLNRVSYTEANQYIYATDGSFIIGIDGDRPFTLSDPPDDLHATMPPGQEVSFWANRLFVASGSLIYISNPMNFDIYRKSDGWLLVNGYVRMMAPVKDGLFVSDDSGVWFLGGGSWSDASIKKITGKPALAWCKINKQKINPAEGGASKLQHLEIYDPFIFVTKDGFCLGGRGGFFIKLTEGRYPYIDSNKAEVSFIELTEDVNGQTVITPQAVLFY